MAKQNITAEQKQKFQPCSINQQKLLTDFETDVILTGGG